MCMQTPPKSRSHFFLFHCITLISILYFQGPQWPEFQRSLLSILFPSPYTHIPLVLFIPSY